MEITSTPLGYLEKPMKFRWCLVFIATILFIDAYLLFRFNMSAQTLSVNWVKDNIDLNESLLFVFFYTFTFSTLISGAGYLVTIMLGRLIINIEFYVSRKLKLDDHYRYKRKELMGYYSIYEYREKALEESNSSMYQEANKRENKSNERIFLRFISKSILLLSIAGWAFSSEETPSMIVSLFIHLDGASIFYQLILFLMIAIFLLALLSIAFEEKEFDRYMLIERPMKDENEVPNYRKPNFI